MSSELKAGIFVLAAIGALAYMTTRLTQSRYSFVGTKTYYAVIQDATGLLAASKVKMAGLDVGQLGNMELAGRQARITLKIAADLVIHKDATIAVKAIGFLGDRYIEIHPGSDSAPVLEEGGYIAEGGATGSLDQLTAKTTQLVDSLKEITDLLRDALKGTSTGESRLDRILDNMERFSEGLADIDRIGPMIDRIGDTLNSVAAIAQRVNRGEGTVGKLINDSETVDRLNSTLSGVQKIVGKADKMQVIVDAKAGALTRVSGGRSSFSIALQPTWDKYYMIGVSTRPQGTLSTKRTMSTINPDTPGATTTTVLENEYNETSFGVDAQLAKRFGDATFRLGLFESTGGVAVDYNFLEDKAKIFSEVYRFTKGQSPQLNVGAEIQVYKPFYIWTGGDFLLTQDSRSFFVGGGLRFSDQDIKTLVGAALSAGSVK